MEVDEDTLDDRMRERITAGAQMLRADAFQKVSDAHLEAKARCLVLFDLLSLRSSVCPRRREKETVRARGLSVRSSLWHGQLRVRAGHVNPTAAGLQKPSAIFAIVLQKVLEILLLATGHDHKKEPVLVEPAQGSLES